MHDFSFFFLEIPNFNRKTGVFQSTSPENTGHESEFDTDQGKQKHLEQMPSLVFLIMHQIVKTN